VNKERHNGLSTEGISKPRCQTQAVPQAKPLKKGNKKAESTNTQPYIITTKELFKKE